jgi:hypothetical protein
VRRKVVRTGRRCAAPSGELRSVNMDAPSAGPC